MKELLRSSTPLFLAALFPRAAAIVHQGGIGTTRQATAVGPTDVGSAPLGTINRVKPIELYDLILTFLAFQPLCSTARTFAKRRAWCLFSL